MTYKNGVDKKVKIRDKKDRTMLVVMQVQTSVNTFCTYVVAVPL